jgi:Predicted hydrolase of the alpha/beta superfamily
LSASSDVWRERRDSRLVAIANELADYDISALCIDYCSYTGGAGEVEDTLFALSYMEGRVSSLGLLGYSYGAVVASNAAAKFHNISGLVLVSPLKRINGLGIDLSSDCSKLIIYGARDSFVINDVDELYRLAEGEKRGLPLDTDHFYLGYERAVAEAVREFFKDAFQRLKREIS